MLRAKENKEANRLLEEAIRAEYHNDIEKAANYYLQLLELDIKKLSTIHDRLAAIGENRHTKSSLYVLGVTQLNSKNNQAAIKTLKRSLERGSEKAAALLANLYLKTDVEKGLYYLQKSITQNNIERTLEFIKSYAEHHPTNVNIGYLYGLALIHPLNKGAHHDEAMQYFMRAAKNHCLYRQQACLELANYYRYTNMTYLAKNTANVIQSTYIAVARLVPITTERTATELLSTLEKGQLTQPQTLPWYNMRAAVYDFHDFMPIINNLIPPLKLLLSKHLKQDLRNLPNAQQPSSFKTWLLKHVEKNNDDALLRGVMRLLYNIPKDGLKLYDFFNQLQIALQTCRSSENKNEHLKKFSEDAQEYIQAATQIWLKSRHPTRVVDLLADSGCVIEKPYPIPTKSNLMYVPDETSSSTTRLLTAMPPQAAKATQQAAASDAVTVESSAPKEGVANDETLTSQSQLESTQNQTSHVRLTR